MRHALTVGDEMTKPGQRSKRRSKYMQMAKQSARQHPLFALQAAQMAPLEDSFGPKWSAQCASGRRAWRFWSSKIGT